MELAESKSIHTTVLSDNIPPDNIPPDNIPSDNIPPDDIPSDNIPPDNIPPDDIPSDDIPSDDIPSDNIPSDNIPSDNIPSDNIPSDDIPSEGNVEIASNSHGKRRRLTLVLLCISCFCGGSAYSLMAPFMPLEAKEKGLSSIQIGIIFGIYQFGLFISSPLIGNYLARLGAKFVVVFGLCACGFPAVLFGVIIYLPPGAPFFAAALILRATDALGSAGVVTACYAMAAVVYPDRMSLAFGLIQTAMSVGLMVSPVIGGVLYQIGGFPLPFFVVGGFTILYGVVFQLALPPIKDVEQERKASVFSLLHSGLVWVTNICIFNSAIGSMFMAPALSLHLQQFNLPSSIVGLLFVITPTFYGLSAPLWGFISDKTNLNAPLIVAGNFLAGVGVLFIGPSPVLSVLPVKIGVIAVGLALLGCFNNCGLIPTRNCLLLGALNLGFDKNLDTQGIVSGMFSSVYCLGAFVGPIASGVSVQEIGFRSSTTVFASFFFLSSLGSATYFLIMFLKRYYRVKKIERALYERITTDDHSQQLLERQSSLSETAPFNK